MSSPSKQASADENGDRACVTGKDSVSEIQPENRASPVPVECAIEVANLDPLEEEGPSIAVDERDCRICHLSMEPPSQDPIELGCACKDDLAAAHRHCAEAWFKIKGNLTCEICGSVVTNITIANDFEPLDRWEDEAVDPTVVIAIPVIAQPRQIGDFWPGHRFINFILACMVFAFIISWLFHFNFPS